jgi:hypothetical protein
VRSQNVKYRFSAEYLLHHQAGDVLHDTADQHAPEEDQKRFLEEAVNRHDAVHDRQGLAESKCSVHPLPAVDCCAGSRAGNGVYAGLREV